MEPTLQVGERFFVNRAVYKVSSPERGDIIVYKTSGSDDAALNIGRVIGLPGETVQISNLSLIHVCMMCSIEELGSTREMYPEAPVCGIYIFPEDAVVGESAIKALGLDDVVFEYEITSNPVSYTHLELEISLELTF